MFYKKNIFLLPLNAIPFAPGFMCSMVKFADMLSDLKAQAEALVLLANDADGLLTCALRPSNVFGPGDTEIIPFLVNQAKSGLAKVSKLLFHFIYMWSVFLHCTLLGIFYFLLNIMNFIFSFGRNACT